MRGHPWARHSCFTCTPSASFGYLDQLSSAFLMLPGLSNDQRDCAMNPLFRYSLPSMMAHFVGSMSAIRSSDIAYAQYPPYCGAYFSGFSLNAARFSAEENR